MTDMLTLGQRQQESESGMVEAVADQNHSTTARSYPKHATQAARLLATLLASQRINPLGGWRQLGIYRLSDTAFQLRGLGWPVVTGKLEVSNKFGEKCRVAEYRLEQEAIDAAGQEAQEFAKRERELREVA